MSPGMPTISGLLSAPDKTDYQLLVNRRLVSITAIRAGAALAAQYVRLIVISPGDDVRSNIGSRTVAGDAIVLGYKGSADYTDTDLQFGDQFLVEGQMFEVIEILPGLDNQFQAVCRLRA